MGPRSNRNSAADSEALLEAVLEKYVGELEAEILRSVWRLEDASAREVIEDLRYRRRPAYTTVNTVLWRLSEKGLLNRTLSGKSYRYTPTVSKDEFLHRLSTRLVATLLQDFGPVAVASFVEQLRSASPGQIDDLRRLIREKKTR